MKLVNLITCSNFTVHNIQCFHYYDLFLSFPGSSSETLLQKFNSVHKDNKFYEMPQRKENAFIVRHYAGRVKYQVI